MNSKRIHSIDVFRALTMLLMIWVNDFWTLQSVPKWLKHASSGEDYLGFSDLIFPWFLFVLGMSIPFSFQKRIQNGDGSWIMCKHIFTRTIALITMGLFHMNMEMYNDEYSAFTKPFFVIITTSAFFLIWSDFSSSMKKNKNLLMVVRLIGILILVFMVLSFTGKDYEGNQIGFKTHWWGILGLIGWVYFIAASAYLIMKNSLVGMSICFTISFGLNILSSSGIPYNIFSWQNANWIPGSGGLQAIAFGGIIVSLLLMKLKPEKNIIGFYSVLLGLGSISFGMGIFLRNYYIISKIQNTPSWILVSLSTAIILFGLIHWITDVKKYLSWYRFISIAGTSTLTCYLIPYFYYNIIALSSLAIPTAYTTGIIGLFKSALYSLMMILIAWIFTRMTLQIKI